MAIKSDIWIESMSLNEKMIEPFENRQVRDGKISFGLSSFCLYSLVFLLLR